MNRKSVKKAHRDRHTKVVTIDGRTQRVRRRNYKSLKEFARETEEGKQWLARKKRS